MKDIPQEICFQDFSRILQAVERGSCRSVDEYAEDLVAQNKTEETKGGDKSSEDFYDGVNEFTKPAFPFGKAVTRSRGIWISGSCEIWILYYKFKFQSCFSHWYPPMCLWWCSKVNTTGPYWW